MRAGMATEVNVASERKCDVRGSNEYDTPTKYE